MSDAAKRDEEFKAALKVYRSAVIDHYYWSEVDDGEGTSVEAIEQRKATEATALAEVERLYRERPRREPSAITTREREAKLLDLMEKIAFRTTIRDEVQVRVRDIIAVLAPHVLLLSESGALKGEAVERLGELWPRISVSGVVQLEDGPIVEMDAQSWSALKAAIEGVLGEGK